MIIVDAQIHVWGADKPERPWPQGHTEPHRPVPFSPDDAIREMDAAGVDRAILVPPLWEGIRNDLALDGVQRYPGRFAIMGRIDPESPLSRGLMKDWRKQPGMLGLRIVPSREPVRTLLSEGRLEWLWGEAEAAGVPIMVFIEPSQIDIIDHIAERYPGLRLILDHLCIPKRSKDEIAFRHLDHLLTVAKRPNIAVKATTLPINTTDPYPFRRLHPYLRRICDAFGCKRVFWGSDVTRMPCPYRQMVTMFTEEIPWLTAGDLEWIMGRGLCEWIGWELA